MSDKPHPFVKTIFDEHNLWLRRAGGNYATEGVRQANLENVVDRWLKLAVDGARKNLQANLTRAARNLGKLEELKAIIEEATREEPAAPAAPPAPGDDESSARS